jgi:hypothetical protein
MCHADCPYPPPPTFLPVWYVEKDMYTESWGTTPQYGMLLSLSLVTQWFSHRIIIVIIISIIFFFILPWERASPPFYRLSPCHVPWLSRVVFQLSLQCLWLPLMRSSPLPGQPDNHLIWVDSSLMDPWASLVLSAFSRLSRGPASWLTVPRAIWSE